MIQTGESIAQVELGERHEHASVTRWLMQEVRKLEL